MAPPFPPVPHRPFWSNDEASALTALDAILSWRREWVGWLTGGERHDGISCELSTLLLELLGEAPTENFRRYPYHLTRFPEVVADADPCAAMRSVLLWRAGLVDFLSDVWDTLGEPEFGMEECQRVLSTLYPAVMQDREVCPLCLDALTSASAGSHFDACAVQSEWRTLRPRR